jgi:hypothetical protein
VELTTDGRLAIRIIVAEDASCPEAAGIGVNKMEKRGGADGDFRITVCQALAPAMAKAPTVGGLPVPTLRPAVQRIVVIGDTGCRLKKNKPPERDEVQDCNDTFDWPFATVARLAAARGPDLVIHVGDYYYREMPCPEERPGEVRPGCRDSPNGDTWRTWKFDFFDPAAPLLAAAPWVFVRGNHESCVVKGEPRGGKGWVRLLDPSPILRKCTEQTEP